MPPRENKSSFSIAISVLLLLAIVLGIVWLLSGASNAPVDTTKVNVQIQNVNLAAAERERDKLPDGFPSSIPIETKNITDSYSMDYVDRGMVQKTVSYKSSKSVGEKFEEYISFMSRSGFLVKTQTKSSISSSIYGTKDNDDLLISISNSAGSTIVSLNFLDRN